MEYRTVSAKLPVDELTMFKAHSEKKGVTPANLIRKLIIKETQATIPTVIAGRNQIRYNKNVDNFTWSVKLDIGKEIDILENVSPIFLENLFKNIKLSLEERNAAIQKLNEESVPVSSDLLGGKMPC